MTDALTRMLAARDWLMADGATGTNLFNMGLSSGEPPEFWNVEKPENIRKLYGDAVAAGSDLFLTNTFGGNAARLKLHQAQGRVRELNRIGAELGREIADKAGRSVVVAGSMGPTGEIFDIVTLILISAGATASREFTFLAPPKSAPEMNLIISSSQRMIMASNCGAIGATMQSRAVVATILSTAGAAMIP